jgi:desulfoferrodoxin (superoxide reductase-like protein)
MRSITRRSFVKTAVASAAFATIGATLGRPALAAEDLKDVKFAKDPKNLQPGLETAHIPSIALEKVEAKSVAYGKTPAGDFYRVTVQAKHEATKEHHIYGIALYLNGDLVAEHTMNQAQAEASLPTVGFVQRLKTGDELLVITTCNVHGKWGNRTTI